MTNLSMSEIEELNEEEYCNFLSYGDPICSSNDTVSTVVPLTHGNITYDIKLCEVELQCAGISDLDILPTTTCGYQETFISDQH